MPAFRPMSSTAYGKSASNRSSTWPPAASTSSRAWRKNWKLEEVPQQAREPQGDRPGILMKSRRLSEDAAYALLRKTADAACCNLGLTPLAFERSCRSRWGSAAAASPSPTRSGSGWRRTVPKPISIRHASAWHSVPSSTSEQLAATRFASPSSAFESARSLSCRRPSWPTRWPRTASMTTASVNPGTRVGRSRHRPHRHRHGAAVAEQPGEGDWLRKAWAQENPEALA